MKLFFFKYAVFSLWLLFITNSCTFNNFHKTEIIKLKGSDTMLELAHKWAAEYMERNPDISIYVEGGGSATGFKALAAGKIDIALASRLINSSEVRLLGEKQNKIGINFLVAKDALSVYLNPENPVKNLTMNQLRAIFNGHIDNWNQAGGEDAKITVVLRPPTSGTFYYFRSHVLDNEPYLQNAVTRSTTRAVTQYVYNHRNAIGYGGLAYGKHVKHVHIEGVAAKEENVRLFKYPLSRYLYLYTIDKPSGSAKKFIDWILSPEGQKTVREAGYISLWE